MAKLRGPLFSFSASGALAKTLVYFSWKGLKVVRQWVIPTNPQSDDQTTQRNIFTAAVAEWHLPKYTAPDKAAWKRFAGISAKPMTAFNAFVKSWIDSVIDDIDDPDPGWGGSINPGAGIFNSMIHEDGAAGNYFLSWGYSKTNMPNTETMTEAPADTWTANNVAATTGKIVYGRFYYEDGAAKHRGKTGIFSCLIA